MRIHSIAILSRNLLKKGYTTNYRNFSTCITVRNKDTFDSTNADTDLIKTDSFPIKTDTFPIISDESDQNIHLNPNKHRRLLDSPGDFATEGQQKLLKVCILGNCFTI